MANIRTLMRSFAGGEIAPELYGRMDLDKFQTGLKRCRNNIVLPYGPAQRRPGTKFVAPTRQGGAGKCRLIPFQFSLEQTVVIELGDQYARFHTNGGTVLEPVKVITGQVGTTLTVVAHGFSANDTVFINGAFYSVVSVADVNSFVIARLPAGPVPSGLDAFTVARVYTVATPYVEADLFEITHVQSSDVLTFTHPSYPPAELRRLGVSNWEYRVIAFTPLLDPPENAQARATTGSGTVLYRYKITAQLQSGLEESFASFSALGTVRTRSASVQTFDVADISAITLASPGVFTTSAAHGLAVNNLVWVDRINQGGMDEFVEGWYLVNTVPTTTTFTLKTEDGLVLDTTTFSAFSPATLTGNIRRSAQVTTSAAHGMVKDDPVFFQDFGALPALDDKFFRVGYVVSSTIIAIKDASLNQVAGLNPAASSTAVAGRITLEGVKNNLAVSPNQNTISWSPVANAFSYRVYKERNGLYGFVGQSLGTSFVDDNIAADVTQTPPEDSQPFLGAGNYPSAVSYFDQRRCFGATDNAPQGVFMTRPGTESNLSSSIPTQDKDAIIFRIAAREQNRIRHLVPLGDLLLLTAGGEWRVFTGSGDPITPASIQARPQSYVGANGVQPQVTSVSVLYVAAQGSRFRELTYSAENGAYATNDISVLTPHYVDGFRIVDQAYMRGPIPVLWAVRDDGALLGMTYLPDQRVRAWHKHDTEGFFESVAVVAEGNDDVLYAVVRRQIGETVVRYIERMEPTLFESLEEAFFVDAGATYRGAPTSVVSNLWHLEGKEVSILNDGAVEPRQVVTDGQIELQAPGSVVHVGLSYVSDFETLPLAIENAQAMGVGYIKNIPKVTLRVYRSSSIWVGPNANMLREVKQRTDEPYGSPPRLLTEEVTVDLDSTWQKDGTVFIRQQNPLPLTIQALSMEVTVGG